MNAFQKFITDHPGGFLKDTDMPTLISLHRLCPVVVRCGGCRFVAGSQDVPHLIKCIQAGGDYVRDVSITYEAQQNAHAWHYEPTQEEMQARFAKPAPHSLPRTPEDQRPRYPGSRFNEADCGGAFDGFQVTSDADPGL